MTQSKLTKSTVAKIAKLARISSEPDDAFLEKYTSELEAVLTHIEQLKKVDTTGISPFDGIRTINIEDLREDEPEKDTDTYGRIRQNIINNFPNKQGDLLVLPGIFE